MIKVEHLVKNFKIIKKQPGFTGAVKGLFSNDYTIKKAVDDISFTIGDGEIVGYIGSNGAGKSTTIKMMTGILVPTSGNCEINGVQPYRERQKNSRQIGVVFGQRTQLWWDLPLTETFSILKEIYEVPDGDFEKRMNFLDKTLGLPEFKTRAVRTLSLGQRMRADLAAALIHNPKVLFLDEPTIGLDVLVKAKLRSAIKEINETYNTTVVLTTHDLGDIEELCTRIILIDSGKIIFEGSIDDIKGLYGNIRTVALDIKDTAYIDTEKIKSHFNLPESDLKVLLDGHTLEISFDASMLGIPDIVSYMMSNAEVEDMKIKETDIENVVKKIYSKGVPV